MFDEVVLKVQLNCKIATAQIVSLKLSNKTKQSLVAISQSSDKLVIHDTPSPLLNCSLIGTETDHSERDINLLSTNRSTSANQVYFIAFKDIIKSIAVVQSSTADDLLLIGCSNSVLVYDALNQNNLQTVITQTPVILIAASSEQSIFDENDNDDDDDSEKVPTICAGSQRLFALKLNKSATSQVLEISSERSIGDAITCLTTSRLGKKTHLVLTGNEAKRIQVYQLDTSEQNIQACRLKLEEHSQVSCLCTITSGRCLPLKERNANDTGEIVAPSTTEQNDSKALDEMSCFAYGLENGYIGVYRLIRLVNSSSESGTLKSERLWRHRCRSTPLTLLLFDLNGDGLDELIVAFKNGRLEARSPFTGQLLAATRCFKQQHLSGVGGGGVERLVSALVVDYHLDKRPMLLTCSNLGSLLGFRPKFTRPRVALQAHHYYSSQPVAAYLLDEQQQLDESLDVVVNANATDLKTIEEEGEQQQQSGDVFFGGKIGFSTSFDNDDDEEADLHISSGKRPGDDTMKTSKSVARQSFELLQRIKSVEEKQRELKRRIGHIYHTNLTLLLANYLPTSSVSIAHQWDFDSTTLQLRLTIVVSSKVETVCLMELEDESKSLLSTGYLLVSSGEPVACGDDDHDAGSTQKSQVVVVALRSSRDVATELHCKVYCDAEGSGSGSNKSSASKLATHVHSKLIKVPKYCMFTFASSSRRDEPHDNDDDSGSIAEHSSRVKVMAQLTRDNSQVAKILSWLNENFLCLKFGKLIVGDDDDEDDHQHQKMLIAHPNLHFSQDNDGMQFSLYLRDARHHSGDKKQVVTVAENNPSSTTTTATLVGCKFANNYSDKTTTQHPMDSSLRVTYCNGLLQFQCESTDLATDLVQSLMIDRLHLQPRQVESLLTDKNSNNNLCTVDMRAILSELDTLSWELRQLEDSEKRIQSELYEASDYTKALMDQLAIANELNEFSLAKELLNELFMMLTEAQNAARTQCLNNRQAELRFQINRCREKVSTCLSSSAVDGC